MNKKNKGSSILVVILYTVMVIIYISSVQLEQAHFEYISKQYKDINKNKYEEEIKNIEEIYDKIIDLNMYNEILR